MIKKPVTIRNSMDMETRPIAHLVQENCWFHYTSETKKMQQNP